MEPNVTNKLSRRKLLTLGAAGAVAVAGTLIGRGSALGKDVTEAVYADSSITGKGNATGIRRVVEEVVQEYTDPLNEQLAQVIETYVNIKDFGAVGDGVSDDSAAIQNAINSSGYVFIPNGLYKVSGLNMLKLHSNLTLYGESKGAVLKVSDNQGDWQSVLYYDGEDVIENVKISNFSIDCNINNSSLTETNGWNNTGRVSILLKFSKNIEISHMNIVTNGFWALRSKSIGSIITSNHIFFDVRNNSLGNYDSSTIWWAGRDTIIENNYMESNRKVENNADIIGRTAIEFQGHRNMVRNNTLIGFKQAIIITNSTSYENAVLDIPEGGNKNSVIEGNVMECQGGVLLWTMFTRFTNPVMKNLTIKNNKMTRLKYSGINFFRPLGSKYNGPSIADGKQNGSIENLLIDGNIIESEDRSNVYHGIDLTPTYDMTNVQIKNNFIKNFLGMGIRTGYYQIFNGETLVDENNNHMKGLVIDGNTFEEVLLPIEFHRGIDDGVVMGNVFRQRGEYEYGKNTVEIIKLRNPAGRYKVFDNILDYIITIKPFLPKMYSVCFNYKTLETEDWQPRVIDELVSVSGRFPNKLQVGHRHLVRRTDGTLTRSGSSFGDTIGTFPAAVTIHAYKSNTGLTPSYLEVSNASVIEPSDVLKLTTNVLDISAIPVIAVEKDRLHIGKALTALSGRNLDEMIGQNLLYLNNLVNV